VAQEMYGELCPFDRFNDVTLAHCFSTLGILKVNDDGCHAKSIMEDEPTVAEQVFNQASAPHHSSIAEVLRLNKDYQEAAGRGRSSTTGSSTLCAALCDR